MNHYLSELQAERKRQGMSLERLAALAGTGNKSNASLHLSGKRSMSLAAFIAYCKALGIEVDLKRRVVGAEV